MTQKNSIQIVTLKEQIYDYLRQFLLFRFGMAFAFHTAENPVGTDHASTGKYKKGGVDESCQDHYFSFSVCSQFISKRNPLGTSGGAGGWIAEAFRIRRVCRQDYGMTKAYDPSIGADEGKNSYAGS